MSLAALESSIRDHTAHLFDYGEEGFLVLEKTGKLLAHVPASLSPDSLDRLHEFFKETDQLEIPPQSVAVQVDVDPTTLIENRQTASFCDAVKTLSEVRNATIRFHFEKAPDAFSVVMSPFVSVAYEKRVIYQIHCPFTKQGEAEKEFLFSSRVRLFHLAESDFIKSASSDAVEDLAEFGFRIPLIWHIDTANVGVLFPVIGDAMIFNYDSGFALPPASESFFPRKRPDPKIHQYWAFLIECYKKYPHYDEVFYPFNTSISHEAFAPENRDLRWNPRLSSLETASPGASSERTKRFLFHSFLWQRWILQEEFREPIKLSPLSREPNTL